MSDLTLSRATAPASRLFDGVWIPLGLLLLGAIPALGGALRLASLTGATTLSDAARFHAHPGTLAVHVVAALAFSVVGAVQLWPGLRAVRPGVHRALGRVLLPAGAIAALSGLATMFLYTPAPGTGLTLHVLRFASGLALLAFLALGARAVTAKDFASHGRWMTRAYAIGIAPGVQALVLVPITIGLGHDTEVTYTVGMALGWAVSLAVAERSVRARDSNERAAAPSADRAPRAAATMTAIVYDRYGGPEELRVAQVPRPTPGPGEIVVRVEASGVNALDRRMVRADPFLVRLANGLVRPRTRVLGADVAGVVEAVGEGVRDRVVGELVFGDLSTHGLGGFATHVRGPASAFAARPEGLDAFAAAALPLAASTALQAVRDRARVRPGQRVLVWGAGGGVGTSVVQIAKAYGAHVTAVCGARSHALVRSLGADDVVDRADPSALAPASFDVLFAVNGDEPLSRSLGRLVPGGTYVMIGGSSRQIFEAVLVGWLHALRTGRRALVLTMDASLVSKDLAEIRALVARGALRAVIDRVMPMSAAADAVRVLESGHVRGKLVLDAAALIDAA
jgi:NADPH:quinone reductase-like Zn-dependent oxidoreductase/uncharacterized membrane protein